MSQVQLDGPTIYKKVLKMHKAWNQIDQNLAPDALFVVLGKIQEDVTLRQNTQDFFVWLLGYEFSDTLVLFTKNKVVFAVSQKKKALLDCLTKPDGQEGPTIEIVLKDQKADQGQLNTLIESLIDKYVSGGKKAAIFQKGEKIDGPLAQSLFDQLSKKSFVQQEMKDFMDQVGKVKIQSEIKNVKVAAAFAEFSLRRMTKELKNCIEGDIKLRHSKIANNMEQMLEDQDKLDQFNQKNGNILTDSQLLDYPLPVLLQSGEGFTLNRFDVESDANKLKLSGQGQVFYMNICAKYSDMHAMASRTMIVNPVERQKAAYCLAFDAENYLISLLKIGSTLSDIYDQTKSFILDRDASLAEKLHKNFGFGIGSDHKESLLEISSTNKKCQVEGQMVFHIRITLDDSQTAEKGKAIVIAIGDTVLIKASGEVQHLTENAPREYQRISFTLEEDEEDEEDAPIEEVKEGKAHSPIPNGNEVGSRRVRANRAQGKNDKAQNEDNIKEGQSKLLDKKLDELKARFENGEIQTSQKKQKQKNMGIIQSYSSIKKFPQGLRKGELYVDEANLTILIPINYEQFVPFHISTVNNVSKSGEGQWTFLRINFQTPPVGKSGALLFPDMTDPNAVFIKELTLKNKDKKGENNHLRLAQKQIQDLIKKSKAHDQEEDEKKDQVDSLQALQMISGRRETLENVVIKPNLEGRKTIGNLEIHKNGISYVSTKGYRVDCPFSNIKHAFFQPCAQDELTTILHFSLKQPITLSNKKVTDVQFFKESGIVADDIDMRGGRRTDDLDELEQEERERRAKKKLTAKFHHFAELIQQQSDKTSHPIEFDVPYQHFFFQGCPLKSVVKIRPTKFCMIAVTEFPFFVIDLKDIEAVHFERVSFGIKNFDMAIIYKDFHTFKRINSIPRESIDEIKSYLNNIGVIFSEGVVPMNWNATLTQIRTEFQDFINEGGWRFLQFDEQSGGEEDGEDEEDDAAFKSAEEEQSDEDSQFSDDDADEDDSDDSDDYGSEGGSDDDGLDWDQMEKQAYDEDKRAAMRRQDDQRSRKPGPPQKKGRR